ncbi:MAG: dihydrofolate reductase family protein [Ardenticatenaceae bacterium]|nr:dihydrofolate reductase family protein [Ardenticatenaceae bacterium]MCB9446595.1 dihydrofolate reductase family protein [Ardenticatenaceae bacterium]
MDDFVIPLYPEAGEKRPLPNLYLDHNIRQEKQPFVYANFVVSLDGRIAIPHPSGQGLTVPKAIVNERDWRLFQELAAQADLIISSGRYLRDWADGRAQEILQTDDPRFADLRRWREEQDLKPQPDIAIISGSLDFPIPDVLTSNGRHAIIFTSANPDPKRVAEIEAQAGQVFIVGEEAVDGQQMVHKMGELGYQTVYSAAGPRILHMLLTGGVLDRLYLTHASRILGGSPFASVVEGGVLGTAVNFQLHSLTFDPAGLDGLGQLFLAYNRV